MRAAGSPGTAGAGFRVAARGDPLTPSAPAQREESTTEGVPRSPEPSETVHGHLTAIPAPRETTDPILATTEQADR